MDSGSVGGFSWLCLIFDNVGVCKNFDPAKVMASVVTTATAIIISILIYRYVANKFSSITPDRDPERPGSYYPLSDLSSKQRFVFWTNFSAFFISLPIFLFISFSTGFFTGVRSGLLDEVIKSVAAQGGDRVKSLAESAVQSIGPSFDAPIVCAAIYYLFRGKIVEYLDSFTKKMIRFSDIEATAEQLAAGVRDDFVKRFCGDGKDIEELKQKIESFMMSRRFSGFPEGMAAPESQQVYLILWAIVPEIPTYGILDAIARLRDRASGKKPPTEDRVYVISPRLASFVLFGFSCVIYILCTPGIPRLLGFTCRSTVMTQENSNSANWSYDLAVYWPCPNSQIQNFTFTMNTGLLAILFAILLPGAINKFFLQQVKRPLTAVARTQALRQSMAEQIGVAFVIIFCFTYAKVSLAGWNFLPSSPDSKFDFTARRTYADLVLSAIPLGLFSGWCLVRFLRGRLVEKKTQGFVVSVLIHNITTTILFGIYSAMLLMVVVFIHELIGAPDQTSLVIAGVSGFFLSCSLLVTGVVSMPPTLEIYENKRRDMFL